MENVYPRLHYVRAQICFCVGLCLATAAMGQQLHVSGGIQSDNAPTHPRLNSTISTEFKYDPTLVEKAPDPPEPAGNEDLTTNTPTPKPSEEPVIEMDTYIVMAQRDPTIQKQIDRLDALIAKADKYSEPSDLDKVLNNPKINIPFLMDGGKDYKVRAAMAQNYATELRLRRILLISMQTAKTLEEYKRYQRILKELQTGRHQAPQDEEPDEEPGTTSQSDQTPAKSDSPQPETHLDGRSAN